MKLRDNLNTLEGYLEIIEETKEFIDSEMDDLSSYDNDSADDKDKIMATYESLFKYNHEITTFLHIITHLSTILKKLSKGG